jgi:electron transport complex protein RnfD
MDRVVLNVAVGPHIHDGTQAAEVNRGYLLALLPAAIWGCIQFGLAALWTLLLAMGSAMLWEWLARKAMKREDTLGDYSALVQGLMVGMIMPADAPWWLILVGTFLVIGVAKQLFGGAGCYPLNPVLIGFAILMVSWPSRLSPMYTLAEMNIKGLPVEPLLALKTYGPIATDTYRWTDLFFGFQSGGIGTVSALFILIGGVFLIARGYIAWRISLSYVLGLVVSAWVFHMISPGNYAGPLFHLLGGMTLFAVFFLASDFTTAPVNPSARLIYGFGAGLLTILIRNFGVYADGTVFAVLFMNLFQPLIDRIRRPVIGLSTG